jgi:hypothetical protein
MTWFKVDEGFHSHNKVRKVIAECPAALGLWVVAGSWSSANLTDGFVPDAELPWLFTDWEPLAQMLVTARLWRRVKGGYSFHEWHRDERSNTVRNPTSDQVRLEREAARLRMAQLRRERKQAPPAVQANVRGNVQRTRPERSQPRPEVLNRTSTAGDDGSASPPSAVDLKPHPFADDGSGKSCKRCGVLKSNKIHTTGK